MRVWSGYDVVHDAVSDEFKMDVCGKPTLDIDVNSRCQRKNRHYSYS